MTLRVTLLLLLLASASFAQAKRPMTVEDVIGLNRASDAQIAPDARRVAFVVTAWDRDADRFNSDIWLTSESREPAVRLTSHPKRDDHPRWSPDARRIAFLSEREGAGREGESGAQIWLLNASGGEPAPLTHHKAAVLDFEWSPDGRFIAFIATAPREKPKTKPPVVVDEDYDFAHIWLLEVATGETRQLTTGARHVTALNWSFDSQQIIFTARATPRLRDAATTELFLASVTDASLDLAATRPLTQGGGAKSEPRLSPDGRWVSYLARPNDAPGEGAGPDRIHLLAAPGQGIVPAATAPVLNTPPRVLAKEFDGYITSYRWTIDSQRVVFTAGLGVGAQLYTMRIAAEGQPPQALTRSDGANSGFSMTADGLNIAFIHENPRVPTEVALLAARIMVPVFLTQLNPQVDQFALGQVEAIKWRSNDGAEIEGLLVYPVGYETGKRAPLVTFIHGGPESAYVKSFNATWQTAPQLYAARGYAVFLPNFRGSSNYGARFAQANARLAGKVDYEDVMSGIDELIKRGIADEKRLAVAGWSYGGYLGGWMIGHTNRFKCAVYGAGLSDAASYWGTADITAQRERLHGGAPWEARKTYDEQSPLTYLANVKTPALIFHGERDERVPLGQSLETYRTLQRLNAKVKLVVYPDQGHALAVPSYQLDKLRRELEWIEKYVMGR